MGLARGMAVAKAWWVGGGCRGELGGLSTWPPGLEPRDRAGRDRRGPVSADGTWEGLGGSFLADSGFLGVLSRESCALMKFLRRPRDRARPHGAGHASARDPRLILPTRQPWNTGSMKSSVWVSRYPSVQRGLMHSKLLPTGTILLCEGSPAPPGKSHACPSW